MPLELAAIADKTLQWSLTLSSEETSGFGTLLLWCVYASMEPHSFERGNESSAPDSDTSSSFNGASLFRARKLRAIARLARAMGRFNGASLFRARKLNGSAPSRMHCMRLQWSLTLSSEETRPRLEPTPGRSRFNGASLFRARKLVQVPALAGNLSDSFNGASLFRARKRIHCNPKGKFEMGFNGASLFRARKPA